MNWNHWPEFYALSPSLRARLETVSSQIAATLTDCPPGPIRITSLCSGDGRDLIGALVNHARRSDVTAWLVDNNPELIARGRTAAAAAGLERQLNFVLADATRAASYVGMGQAGLVIISGLLGHLRPESVARLIEALPMLCREGGWVIWNRHLALNGGEQMVSIIRKQLRETGFAEIDFRQTGTGGFAAGRVRFAGPAVPLDPKRELFKFTGLDTLVSESDSNQGTARDLTPERLFPNSATFPFEVEQSIPSRFAQVLEKHASRPAIGSGDRQLTYGELNTAANRLAHTILAGAGQPGERVALLLRHDAPLIIALLATLKAGRIVVVLNPADPPPRLRQVVDDAGAAMVVTDMVHRELAEQITVAIESFRPRIIDLGSDLSETPTDPELEIAAGDVAFLLYTSGTTGKPKGVMQTHRNMLHNVARHTIGMELRPEDRVALFASPGGGQGMATTWSALLNGAAICPFPAAERGVTGLGEFLAEQRITAYVSSVSVFRAFVRTLPETARFPDIRVVRFASEAATRADFAAFQRHFTDGCFLLNALASTETGTLTRQRFDRNDRVDEERLPAGRAVEGMEILLLDSNGQPVGYGESGELAVRSRYLSPGYWRNDALTAERFSGDDAGGGLRTFRSGDLGRWTADGRLIFAGRHDAQVKVRGYRIEISEIENALARVPGVETAIVCAREKADGDTQLIAYVVCRAGSNVDVEVLRNALLAGLPSYMLPSGFVFLDRFPLMANGKIDREKLRQLQPVARPPAGLELATETERLLALIWQEVFDRAAVGRDDHFLDLGGDSLNATLVAARVHKACRVELDLRAFTDHPRLAELAGEIDRRAATVTTEPVQPLVRVSREVPLPLSFAQERIWKHSRTPAAAAGFTVACGHRLRGPLNREVLRASLDHLIRRHEILRTTFLLENEVPRQRVQAPAPVPLPFTDFVSEPDPAARATERLREDARQPFDLERGPLLRFQLARIRPDEHWLLRVNHHLISDSWSWRILFRELAAIYEAGLRGEAPPLPDFEPLQFADYAVWQRQNLETEGRVRQEEIDWWRERFAGLPPVRPLPFQRRRHKSDARVADGLMRWGIAPEVSRRFNQIGRAHDATPFTVRLAALAAFLAAETKQPDRIIGTYVTERARLECQSMFGCFTNLIALRLCGDPAQPFSAWIVETQRSLAAAHAHAEIPCELLGEELRRQGTEPPGIDLIFSAADHTRAMRFGGLELDWLEREFEAMPWGFTLAVDLACETNRCYAAFDAGRHQPWRVRRWLNRFQHFLEDAAEQPALPVRRLRRFFSFPPVFLRKAASGGGR